MTRFRWRWSLRALMALIAILAIALAWNFRSIPVTVVNQTGSTVAGAWFDFGWGRVEIPRLRPGQSCAITLPPWSREGRYLPIRLTVPDWARGHRTVATRNAIASCESLRLRLIEIPDPVDPGLEVGLDFKTEPGIGDHFSALVRGSVPNPRSKESFTVRPRVIAPNFALPGP